jgi:hypothetical protein
LVAAITRTSTLIVCESPAQNSRSCSAQQFHLQRRAHRAASSSKSVPLCACSSVLAVADGASKGAAHVAEARLRAASRIALQFSATAVPAPRADLMNGARHDLLAGSCFAADGIVLLVG